MTTDPTKTIAEYEKARNAHREAEIKIAQAKAQIDVYKQDIANILASENVDSIEKLKDKYEKELENLKAVTNVLVTETDKAKAILSKLGVQ